MFSKDEVKAIMEDAVRNSLMFGSERGYEVMNQYIAARKRQIHNPETEDYYG